MFLTINFIYVFTVCMFVYVCLSVCVCVCVCVCVWARECKDSCKCWFEPCCPCLFVI